MLVEKAIGTVPHSGGKLFSKHSKHWETLVNWLKDGANKDPEDVAKPTKIQLFPPSALLEGNGATQQLTVLAHYSDGTTRDVTPLTVFQSSNDVSAAVDDKGLVTAGSRGEAFMMARFNIFTVGVPMVVIPEDLKYQRPQLPANNYVDTHVHNKLHKLRMTPSELCSDEVFVRRLYLDITGLLPTLEESAAFLADSSPDKRSMLIDQLLERKEFTELWVMKFAELLQIQTDDNQGMSYKATLLYFNWLKDRIANNVPMDQIVKDLLTSKGGTFKNPATNYYQVERDNLKITENVAQVFMGMRLQCAQCHNHPFDRWTQDEYYSFASFFSQVGRKRAADPRENIIYNRRSGEINHPVHKSQCPPNFLEMIPLKFHVVLTVGKCLLSGWLPQRIHSSPVTWPIWFGHTSSVRESLNQSMMSGYPIHPPTLNFWMNCPQNSLSIIMILRSWFAMFVIPESINSQPRQILPTSQIRGILRDLIFVAYVQKSCSM